MTVIHLTLAYAAVAFVIAGVGWSVVLTLRRETGGPGFEQFQAAVVALVVIGAVSGLVMLPAGQRPADGLHLVYAVIAIGLIPLARSFLGRASGRRAALLLVAAFVVLGVVAYRLFTTG